MKNINYDMLASELDAIKMDTLGKVGQQDADYIRSVVRKQRVCEWSGRILLMLGFIQPLLWVAGVLLLALAKILDNRIDHALHCGQFPYCLKF